MQLLQELNEAAFAVTLKRLAGELAGL